ncbi:MAG: NblA/ycf18 family protein [Spirulinaceae cyanobacterium]
MNPEAFNLTVEQQFQMRLIAESAHQMNREQMQDLLVETTRLLMVKDNVIRSLMKLS